jgi:hypothetical protein
MSAMKMHYPTLLKMVGCDFQESNLNKEDSEDDEADEYIVLDEGNTNNLSHKAKDYEELDDVDDEAIKDISINEEDML